MSATATLDILTSDQFTWDGRTGTAMASDVGLHAGYWPESLRVNSTRTGGWLRFERHSQETRDGDLLWVTYLAVRDGLFVSLRIFND